jgi:DNA polymerase (family X)
MYSMHPSELSQFFEDFAALLEIRGNEEDSFPILAYKRAAETLRDHEGDIEKLVQEGKLHTLPGIGKRIEEKTGELMKTGKVQEYEELINEVPETLLDVLKVPFLGPKKASALFHELKVKDLASLEKALKSGKAEKLPRFGKKTVDKFLDGLKLLEKIKGRTLLGDAIPIVNDLLTQLKKCKDIQTMEVAGSYRRHEETIGDIDILTTVKNAEKVADFVAKLPDVEHILGKGDTKVSVLMKSGLQVDVRMVEKKSYGAALQYFTGSKAHNVELRAYAKSKGYKISEYGIFRVKDNDAILRGHHDDTENHKTRSREPRLSATEEFIAGTSEAELYETIGMDFIPPELRQASGEIEAALNHELPKLVETGDIKGDLHCHSTWSDGKNSIEEMARSAEKKGYAYIAISDHSPSLAITGGPKTKADVLKKKKEIEAVQKKVKITILCGTEVDIMKDGSLDYPDEILKEFDIVIAAIHSAFEGDQTERLLKAIRHPLVHAIAHPTSRKIGERQAIQFDEDAIYSAAAQTGTWLEINGQPVRLDLPYTMVRKAKNMGVKFIVSSDAHSIRNLDLMDLGISVARRGWLEKKDVVNTLSQEKFLSARKKEVAEL